MFKEFLDHVITKDIGHQLNSVGEQLSEDLILLVAVGCLELLLNESRTVLVTTELNNVIVDVLYRD